MTNGNPATTISVTVVPYVGMDFGFFAASHEIWYTTDGGLTWKYAGNTIDNALSFVVT